MLLGLLIIEPEELADRCPQDRRAVCVLDVIRLFPHAAAFIDPLEPAADRRQRSVFPGRAEEPAVGDLLRPGVDRRRALTGLERPPSPSDRLGD